MIAGGHIWRGFSSVDKEFAATSDCALRVGQVGGGPRTRSEGTGGLLNPLKAGALALIDAANKVGIVPLDESGATFSLPSLGVEAMREEAGVPITRTRTE